jgi:broad specificity phosphatase PhoE
LLAEVDYGEYEGLTSRTIHESRPDWEIFKDGSPGGETPAQIYARAQRFIDSIEGVTGRVLAFAHGHILRATAVAWLRLDIRVATQLQLDVATLSILRRQDRDRFLSLWNSA